MYITAHSTPEPPGNKNCIFNCVADPGTWTLTETDKYCETGTYAQDSMFEYTLRDCEEWCDLAGARTLTFFPNRECFCCTASSELKASSTRSQIHTYPGE